MSSEASIYEVLSSGEWEGPFQEAGNSLTPSMGRVSLDVNLAKFMQHQSHWYSYKISVMFCDSLQPTDEVLGVSLSCTLGFIASHMHKKCPQHLVY